MSADKVAMKRDMKIAVISALTGALAASAATAEASHYLITSASQIKPGTIQLVDLSKTARAALRGQRGLTGPAGASGQQGTPGQAGTPGQPGAAGTARAYALVNPDGTFVAGWPHPGFTAVSNASTGFYCLTPATGVDPHTEPAVASTDWETSSNFGAVAMFRNTYPTSGVCTSSEYEIATANGGSAANEGFSVIVP